jgi:tetratricopeptide (TPR) repeat protein
MNAHELNDETYANIRALCAKGDNLAESRQFELAFANYREALNLVPEPVEDWEATTWILAAIGDVYFLNDMFEKALGSFSDAVRCPGGLGNPFIHLRIGQCWFELGNRDRAVDELTRAYMGAGREIFENADPKYLQFLGTRITPPAGERNL